MSQTTFRAINTRYKGYNFRSRLEARWAVFFDHLGIRWDYEPEGFELGNGLRYLPDFWLPDWGLWVEIKPASPDSPAIEKASRLAGHSAKPVVVVNGMPGNGGVLYAMPVGHTYVIEAPCEVDWGARDGKYVWMFRDDLPAHTSLHCWGGTEVFVTPSEMRGELLPTRLEPALVAARGARFEFGQEGA